MTDWHGWEVVCVERAADPAHADCRSIERVGHLVANTLRTRGVDTVHAMIDSGLSRFYVAVEGERRYLQPATHEGGLYVRTLETDSADDPVLELPACEEYDSPRS